MSLAVGLGGIARRIDFLLIHYHYTAVSLSNTLVSSSFFLVVIPSQCGLCLVETSLKNVRCNHRHLRVGFGRGDVNSWTRKSLLNEVGANYCGWPSTYELHAVDVICTPEDPLFVSTKQIIPPLSTSQDLWALSLHVGVRTCKGPLYLKGQLELGGLLVFMESTIYTTPHIFRAETFYANI